MYENADGEHLGVGNVEALERAARRVAQELQVNNFVPSIIGISHIFAVPRTTEFNRQIESTEAFKKTSCRYKT